jgi:hypothetical protein
MVSTSGVVAGVAPCYQPSMNATRTAKKSEASEDSVRATVPTTSSVKRLVNLASSGELIAVVGTGVSIALTDGTVPALSWTGLIRDGFAYGQKKGRISDGQAKSWEAQLDSEDLDDLILSAEFVGLKLGAPKGDLYARWFEEVFAHLEPTNVALSDAIRRLSSSGVRICTLNYDTLLEKVTGLSAINLSETAKVSEWMRKDSQAILHLHGCWNAPSTCVLGIRDYESTLGDEVRDLIQRNLGAFQRLLFVGCGDTFADPNFSALTRWLRQKLGTAAPQHFAAVQEGDLAKRHADPAWHGFVEPLSYGPSHAGLASLLTRLLPPPAETPGLGPGERGSSSQETFATNKRLLEEYRTFLVKDCGQMTIEGVRADMDTAQRRFELERLFVPLNVLPCPPEFPESDPRREQKLLKWHERNRAPRSFSSFFSKHKGLALLALPGGGKTLLLKRLAVAYADPSRRQSSGDDLPDLDLVPVLIRCREWREHIRRPIMTLLRSIPDITGQSGLTGLSDALIPQFASGQVLLLIDGLDEIHDDADRSTFVEHLEAFLDQYKATRLVVTSREAGFSLSRFCERVRVAPLSDDAIVALCHHWHRLMVGDSTEALAEGREVAELLLRNTSLRRLAENPLLLTMLLVVKHGAGRLPPDRVSLYDRAVEVLLDTWNIKGHEALNLKEAVPQLACVAFELLRAGKQTATEQELLSLLEQAREKVPQIRRYARDTPHDFLKRVELRSSLLLEAGHQVERGRTVPFYQFRHLTFQEYLAAVAIAEGHCMNFQGAGSVLVPLASCLTSDEWKEVIPMTAVLARKQAEPLMTALVDAGETMRAKLDAREGAQRERSERTSARTSTPEPSAAIGRLVQCLIEEAEASPETLARALKLIALFAKPWEGDPDLANLCHGPYGEELLHQSMLLYLGRQWGWATWLPMVCARVAYLQRPHGFWITTDGQQELRRMLDSAELEAVVRGLHTCVGLMFGDAPDEFAQAVRPHLAGAEKHLFSDDARLWAAATWVWALAHYRLAPPVPPSLVTLDRLLSLWLTGNDEHGVSLLNFAFGTQLALKRGAWTPRLSPDEVVQVRRLGDAADSNVFFREGSPFLTCLFVAFHARSVWPDEDLIVRLDVVLASESGPESPSDRFRTGLASMHEQLGVPRQRRSRAEAPRQRGKK